MLLPPVEIHIIPIRWRWALERTGCAWIALFPALGLVDWLVWTNGLRSYEPLLPCYLNRLYFFYGEYNSENLRQI